MDQQEHSGKVIRASARADIAHFTYMRDAGRGSRDFWQRAIDRAKQRLAVETVVAKSRLRAKARAARRPRLIVEVDYVQHR